MSFLLQEAFLIASLRRLTIGKQSAPFAEQFFILGLLVWLSGKTIVVGLVIVTDQKGSIAISANCEPYRQPM